MACRTLIRLRHLLADPMLCLAMFAGIASTHVAAEDALLWFLDGLPTAEAHQAVEILAQATSEGLDPADYEAESLAMGINNASATGRLPSARIEQLDQTLTSAMQRYLSDLHSGRITPEQVRADYSAPTDKFDAASYLRNALSVGKLAEYSRNAVPASPFYDNLRQALARYRPLQQHPAWQAPLPPLPGKKLEAGQSYAGVALLAHRLQALGDLAPDATANGLYDARLAQAVRAFQQRHGLVADGVIGAKTLEQLQITPAQRVGQITLNMERLRWTPIYRQQRMIHVNIPEFALRAFEGSPRGMELMFYSRIIVGNAGKTRTPLFDETMRFIEFSPYWNVPRSIARGETIPKLRRDPAYFYEQGFEFVGNNRAIDRNLSHANIEAVLRGEQRIRQRPGPENALGKIKFIFPNQEHIYMHDTPAKQLFTHERRDFSHGCIRIQYPFELAKFVLRDDPAWDETRITEAMDKGESRTIRLREPIPVVLAYQTVMVANDERIYFFPDIYGYDQLLENALRQRKPSTLANTASSN